MRKIITFSLLVISVFVVHGAAQCDSIKVYFALNKATFELTHDNDYNSAASMEKFIDGIAMDAKSGNLDHIDVFGYASPDGPFPANDMLAVKRCNAIADYISRHAGIPLNDIHTYPGGVAWSALRTLALENTDIPSRDAVLQVLDEYTPAACTNRALSEQCMKRLNEIDNGLAYEWMLENLFPKLRYSLAVYTYDTPDNPIVQTTIEDIDFTSAVSEDILTDYPTDILYNSSYSYSIYPDSSEPLHRLAVKTNLLYYGILLPNLEVEWRINKNWSVALEGDIAMWGSYSKEKSYRLVMVAPEVRRWIRPRTPWKGFYAGLFAGGGLYDFEKGTGYYGHGVFTGLSIGYVWPISRCLSLEAAVGAGYLYTRYKKYHPLDGHHVYQLTKDIHYFGPLKVKFSLVWRLWDLNKNRRASEKRNNIAR